MASNAAPDEAAVATFPAPPAFFKLYAPDSTTAPPGPPAPPSGSFQVFDRMFSLDEPMVPTTANHMVEPGPDGTIGVCLLLNCVMRNV